MKQHYPREAGHKYPEHDVVGYDPTVCPDNGTHDLRDTGGGVVLCRHCGRHESHCK